MNGFDWNNNGQNDLFDSFMDYHVCNESSNNNQPSGHPTKSGGMSKGAVVLIVLAIIGRCCQIGSCVMG